jgi:hypothetical protein
MKKSTLNLLATTLVAVLVSSSSFAKTYTIVNNGKWSDATIWENGVPGNEIQSTDVVIVKNHVVVSSDISILGTMIVEKGNTLVSNKSLAVGKSGRLVNNGSVNVKRLMNEGEIQNSGNFNNNVNVLSGTNILNYGGSLNGEHGTFFANQTVINSPDATIAKTLRVFVGGDNNTTQTAVNATSSSDFSIETFSRENAVTLSINNNNQRTLDNVIITRSFDGNTYEQVASIPNSLNQSVMLYSDKNINHSTVYYKVQVESNGSVVELPLTTVGLPYTQQSQR